jgi:hypothetical protein
MPRQPTLGASVLTPVRETTADGCHQGSLLAGLDVLGERRPGGAGAFHHVDVDDVGIGVVDATIDDAFEQLLQMSVAGAGVLGQVQAADGVVPGAEIAVQSMGILDAGVRPGPAGNDRDVRVQTDG